MHSWLGKLVGDHAQKCHVKILDRKNSDGMFLTDKFLHLVTNCLHHILDRNFPPFFQKSFQVLSVVGSPCLEWGHEIQPKSCYEAPFGQKLRSKFLYSTQVMKVGGRDHAKSCQMILLDRKIFDRIFLTEFFFTRYWV